ncbi:MAG: nitroreductase/quinone reductase family protein [Acidimicrobiales bacterium]
MMATDASRPGIATRVEHLLDSRSVPLAAWLYRRSGGRLARLYRRKVMVLTTTGRRSGQPRTVVVQYFADGRDMIIVAANSGMPTHPAWYQNLMADPHALVEIDNDTFNVEATALTAEEAAEFWPRVLDAAPDYARFSQRTDRAIPLVRLCPSPSATAGAPGTGAGTSGAGWWPRLRVRPKPWMNAAMRTLLRTLGIRRRLGRSLAVVAVTDQSGSSPCVDTVTIRSGPRPMNGFVAAPTAGGPWPGVIVIHDALGPSTDLQNQVRWLADEGFLAVAPDLYSHGGRLRCMFSAMRALTAGHGPTFDDLAATREWLEAQPNCTGRIGVIGFCLGGGYALALAGTGQFAAANANYGDAPSYEPDRFSRACPIIATYGQLDRSLRSAPERLRATLDAVGIDHEIITYTDAGHGFLNDHPPDETPLWASIASRLVVTGYHGPSAHDARHRIIAFFDQHLRDDDDPTA